MKLWPWIRRHHLVILLVIVAIKQIVLISIIPPWKVQDEPAHFQYTQTIIEEKTFPVFPRELDDFSPEVLMSVQRVLDQLQQRIQIPHSTAGLNLRQSAPTGTAPENYAAPYGPVYYLVESIPYITLRSQPIEVRLTAMRYVSTLWFIMTVWLAYRIVRRLRGSAGPALTVAAMVGFFPTLSFVAAGVNNDVFLLVLATAVFERLSGWQLQPPSRRDIILTGILAGLAAMTKQSGWIIVAIAAFALFMIYRRQSLRKMAGQLVVFGIPAITLGLSWTVRAWLTGAGDFISREVLNRFASLANVTFGWILLQNLLVRPVEVWGTALGWFGTSSHYPMELFVLMGMIIIAGIVGLILLFRSEKQSTPWLSFLGLGIFGWVILEVMYQALFWQRALAYHIVGFPNQGRYYFLLIVPLMALLLAGLEQLTGLKYRRWAWIGLSGLMIGLTIWSIPILLSEYSGVD